MGASAFGGANLLRRTYRVIVWLASRRGDVWLASRRGVGLAASRRGARALGSALARSSFASLFAAAHRSPPSPVRGSACCELLTGRASLWRKAGASPERD